MEVAMIAGESFLEHYNACRDGRWWITVPKTDAQIRIRRVGDNLYIDFQEAKSWVDWIMLGWFWKKKLDYLPHKVHTGFAKKYDSLVSLVRKAVRDNPDVDRIIVRGFSKGAGFATMCACDLSAGEKSVTAIAFGGPRVFEKGASCENLLTVHNRGDIITMLPPKLLGYRHVGKVLKIGEGWRVPRAKWHEPKAYRKELSEGDAMIAGDAYEV